MQALTLLKNWKGSNNSNEIAPTLFNKWVYFYLKNTFEDEMGTEKFNLFFTNGITNNVVYKYYSTNYNIENYFDRIRERDVREYE